MLLNFVNISCVFKIFMFGWARCFFLLSILVLFCSGLFACPFMIKKPTIAIVDDFHSIFVENLNPHFNVLYQPNIPSSEVIDFSISAEIIAVRSKIKMSAEVIEQLPNLKCIARGGAGMDNIDEIAAQEKGIVLLNAPEGNRNAVAEHCLGLLLNISNQISKGNNEVKNGIWDRESNRGFEISGKTIGIIGYGNTGKAFAKLLSSFNCQVVAYDKYITFKNDSYAHQVELSELLNNSDVISLHVPLTKETNQFFNQSFLNLTKNEIVLLNTSRGAVINYIDLMNCINGGKKIFLGLDVLENENLEHLNEAQKSFFNFLVSNNQSLITPHVAGWTKESYYKIADVLSQKIINYSINKKKIS